MISRAARSYSIIAVALVLTAKPATSAGDVELGRYLSESCVTCHQVTGRQEGIPAITGWEPEQFVAVMSDYKNRVRSNAVMYNIVAPLSTEDIAALAAFFGSLGSQKK